jgi:hypothetical protein
VAEIIGLGTQIGSYRITGLIAQGGMATVYLADRLPNGGQAALKVMSRQFGAAPDFRERFMREFRYAGTLDHPNVVRVHDVGEASGLLYLALEYVPGTDLRTLLSLEGRLEPERALAILAQVAAALDAAHARGILHRDVKPGNVLIASGEGSQPAGHSYLTDFGLSKRSAGDSVSITAPGDFVGTVHYTAPEEILGRECDHRVDVYSLGCVLYECLAGEPPFARARETDVLYGHVQEPPPKLTERRTELPAALDEVVARALAKEPEERFGSCQELIAAARAALSPPELTLKVTAGNAAGTEIVVADEFLIGRAAGDEGRLAEDAEISRRHAQISRRTDGAYVIEDLGSTNGTFVNGNRLERPQVLAAGDMVAVGNTLLVAAFTAARPAEPPERPAAVEPPAAPAATVPARLSLRLEVDWDGREVLLGLEEGSEPVRIVYEDGRWRVVAGG